MIYEYKASLIRVVDGDTVWLDIDLGFNVHASFDFRLVGLNAPEMVGSTKTAGVASKNELDRLLSLGPLRVVSMKSDKYGRWLATIYVKQPDGTELNVNEELVKGGYAVPYNP